MSLGKHNIKEIRKAIQTALNECGEEIGLELTLGGISYDPSSFTASLKAQVPGALTREEKAYDELATLNNLPKRGTIFRSANGKIYEIQGWNTRAKRYPIVVLGEDDKTWRLPIVTVKGGTIIRAGSK